MPLENSHIAYLTNRRPIHFSQYGAPDGTPVFYFHGCMSAGIDIAFAHAHCRDNGIRIIAPDRPGIGRSPFRPGRTLPDWPRDMALLADELGIGRFSVFGWSGGGPYALACAYAMPERLVSAATVGGIAPLSQPGMKKGLVWIEKVLVGLCLRAPLAASWMLWPAARIPATLVKRALLVELSNTPDRAIVAGLARAEVAAMPKEALLRGTRGTVWDYRVVGGDWGFDPGRIKMPVTLWQGEGDALVPPAHAKCLESLIPGARANILAGRGHFLLRTDLARVLEGLVSPA